MVDAVRNNEWELQEVRRSDDDSAVIEFTSYSYLFGGTGCLIAIAESLGRASSH
jgi:hypothetical protein